MQSDLRQRHLCSTMESKCKALNHYQSLRTDQPQITNQHLQKPKNRATMYFIVKSCNRENLELSVQQGVWATQRCNESKLNEAFDSMENVILIFSVNRTRHFQGCAKMTSRIGGSVAGDNWKYAGTAHYGRNFSVKWLKDIVAKLFSFSHHTSRALCSLTGIEIVSYVTPGQPASTSISVHQCFLRG
ncbi:30-kDa cleavage and polyadenylation specificity factor 30 isoform X2 [Vigna radiata var. radiata]|uniref:YTH domain-containing family protein n=1 Tax=Vigna radiata var. radiata TaxID=3916 RepID=A0A3Q0F6S8_VIGRR|nr:30-kDa cleavage and polyadenylation specificity factor 30 isoform X2 [Vigna radiata var. radiata]